MKIRIGSRDSRLAVIQSEMVIDAIRAYDPTAQVELVTMKTTGDLILDRPLSQIGGKGLFVKELDKIVLSKNYCRISVKMTGESGAVYPFSLETLGNVSGYGFDMTPEHGDFRYVMKPDTEGIFHVNVPRQYDSSLILRVAEDDRSLRDFAIGEYLEEGGYDWTARELADVELVIDYAKADLTLTVEDWEVSFGFNVVI